MMPAHAGGRPLDPLELISELVRKRAGLVFPPSRRSSFKLGVDRAFLGSGAPDRAAWLKQLQASADAFDDLLIELTVGETFFFRDPQHFDRLRDEALPQLLSARPPEHLLKFWSAGCATGEEPYSIAMLLADLGLLERASVLGTDLSRASLSRAERGVYRPWSLRGPGKTHALRHLAGEGQRYEVPPRIKERVRLAYLNLAAPGWPSMSTGVFGLDVIFCRNVLIYFGEDTIQEVLARFCAALSPGGWLVLGPSDPLATGVRGLETLMRPEGLFYRRTGPQAAVTPMPPAPAQVSAPPPAPEPAPEPAPPPPPSPLRPEDELVVRIRTLANHDLPNALATCLEALQAHPVSAPLHFLLAVLLLEVGRLEDARDAARRALYLDGTLEVVQLLLGTLWRQMGQRAKAIGAFERAAELAGRRGEDAQVPLGEGATAAQFREAALGAAAVLRREQ